MSIYRKLLDGANDDGQGGLRQLVEQVVKTTGLTEVADTGEIFGKWLTVL